MQEKELQVYNKKFTKVKAFLGYYYMPFSLEELFLFFPYLALILIIILSDSPQTHLIFLVY